MSRNLFQSPPHKGSHFPKVRDLNLWEAFLAVARRSSFVKAAEDLRLSPPQLTKRIAALEDDLKLSLFRRTTRSVSLTDEGKRLLPEIQSVLQTIASLETPYQQEAPSGHLRIACLPAFGIRILSQAIVDFQKQFPKITFEIFLSDHLLDMVEHELDIAIRVAEPKGANYIYQRWMPNKTMLCCSPTYLKSITPPKTPDDLSDLPLYFLKQHEGVRFVKDGRALSDFQSQRPIVCDNGLFLTQLALDGAGIVLRSEWDIFPLIDAGKLVPILKNHPLEAYGSIYLVTPPLRVPKPLAKIFLDYLAHSRSKS